MGYDYSAYKNVKAWGERARQPAALKTNGPGHGDRSSSGNEASNRFACRHTSAGVRLRRARPCPAGAADHGLQLLFLRGGRRATPGRPMQVADSGVDTALPVRRGTLRIRTWRGDASLDVSTTLSAHTAPPHTSNPSWYAGPRAARAHARRPQSGGTKPTVLTDAVHTSFNAKTRQVQVCELSRRRKDEHLATAASGCGDARNVAMAASGTNHSGTSPPSAQPLLPADRGTAERFEQHVPRARGLRVRPT